MKDIIFLLDKEHYLDHIYNIYNYYNNSKYLFNININEDIIIYSYIYNNILRSLKIKSSNKDRKPLFFVSSHSSLSLVAALDKDAEVVYMDHGCGQTMDIDHFFWSRINNKIPYKNNMKYFIAPNEIIKKVSDKNNPGLKSFVGGCPKMDKYKGRDFSNLKENELIVFSWHWDCKACPETLGGFEYWKQSVLELSKNFNVALHGHPRIKDQVKSFCEENNLVHIEYFDEVLETAWMYCCDMSSTIFEFARTNRPVVLLNNPWFRRDVSHGMRFWEFSDIGINCDSNDLLEEAIVKGLNTYDLFEERRTSVSDIMYPNFGCATNKYIEILEELANVTS